MLVAELLLGPNRIGRDPDNVGLGLGEGAPQRIEVDRFLGAARRVGLG